MVWLQKNVWQNIGIVFIVQCMSVLPGITNSKRSALFIALFVVGFFLIVDPFHWFSQSAGPSKQTFSAEKIADIQGLLQKDRSDPTALIAQAFSTKRLVMVGTQNFVKEELDFVRTLLPALPAMGVTIVGFEYLRAEDQTAIDSLFSAKEFDENLAKDLMFRRLPLWGYQEYLEILRAAWETNQAPSGKLRIIGLSLSQDFSAVRKNADFRDPEIMKSILAQGRSDAFLAETVFNLLNANQDLRMLVVCQRISAIGGWEDKEYTAKLVELGFPGELRAGRILRQKLPSLVETVLFHGPLPSAASSVQASFPLDGLIDVALDNPDKKAVSQASLGFSLKNSRLGRFDSGANDYSRQARDQKAPPVLLADLADIYIIFGPIYTLHSLKAIPDFVTPQNLPRALAMLPTVREADSMSADILNDEIQGQATDFEKALASFR